MHNISQINFKNFDSANENIFLIENACEECLTSDLSDLFISAFDDNSIFKTALFSSIKGGKMARALRFLSSASNNLVTKFNEFTPEIKTALICGATAIELFQTAMLIHDDIIDNDEVRRGIDSVWKKIGKERAILAGDIVLTASNKSFANMIHQLQKESAISANTAEALKNVWFEMSQKVLFGQLLDEEFANIKITDLKNFGIEELIDLNEKAIQIAQLKTASYTTVGPTILGQMIANNASQIDSNLVDKLTEEGVKFQLQNDIDGAQKDLQSGNLSRYFVLEEIKQRGDK